MAEEFRNMMRVLEAMKKGRDAAKDLPAKHPKINSIFKDIKYNHSSGTIGPAIGMTEAGASVLADKFAKAEEEAKRQGESGWYSRCIEILMPTLTPQELVFCASHVLGEKIKLSSRLGG